MDRLTPISQAGDHSKHKHYSDAWTGKWYLLDHQDWWFSSSQTQFIKIFSSKWQVMVQRNLQVVSFITSADASAPKTLIHCFLKNPLLSCIAHPSISNGDSPCSLHHIPWPLVKGSQGKHCSNFSFNLFLLASSSPHEVGCPQ